MQLQIFSITDNKEPCQHRPWRVLLCGL